MNPNYFKGETWGFPGAAVDHVETHAAHVFLVGNRAFKMKKDVKLPYLDFSTIDLRRAVIAHELEINRPNAPEIYIGTAEVEGEPVLVMKRFAAQDVLAKVAERARLEDTMATRLAAMAAAAHRLAPVVRLAGSTIMAGLGAQLSRAFTSARDIFSSAATLEFHALYQEALRRHTSLLNGRGEQGLVRRCHGDMHCGNIVLVDGKPVLFDAIEFSEKIATIDVLYDLAFLLMDLLRHGQRVAANLVLNRYLGMRRAEEDLSGLAVLPLFLSTRAGVRALVTADLVHELPAWRSAHERGQALDYFRECIAFLKPARPRLLCIGGLSGTGKSRLARSLAPDFGASPGAIHIRSDIERKVLAGVAETQRLPQSAYSRKATAAVYDALISRATKALSAGHSVILDAVFANETERRSAENVARNTKAEFEGLWLEAEPATLKARVAARVGDASDADQAVVDRQLGYDLGKISWQVLDAAGSPTATEAKARSAIATFRSEIASPHRST
jgi:aminoglycoside phosphotransferase family enzyme/predicted kinase